MTLIKKNLAAILFPPEKRRLKWGRAVRIALRTIHILAFSALFGGHWFGAPAAELLPWLYWTALSGGINAGDRSGDQGVLAVVEPRDAQGRTVDAPADMSLVVIDPALEGDAARVARWDFSADQIALMFRRTGAGQAIHVEAPWPGDPPAHNKLHLFVRYTTADGRKLEAHQPIEIALAGDNPARWTQPEASGRSGGAASEADPPALLNAPEAESLHRTQSPAARPSGPPPRGPSRSAASKPKRPTWSPERQ
jgi:hypothetical protein